MNVLISLDEVTKLCQEWRDQGNKVSFVPTMGALHEGQLSLVRKAREVSDRVVVSIFVNPTQFGPNEDFARYPRPIEKDTALLESEGADALFMPNVAEIYPPGFQTYLVNHEMAAILCGKRRANHFSGVLTVVLKLLNIVRPHLVLLGKKDYQQLRIIEKMMDDLHVPVEIVPGDTVREPSGLAMSSRNQYLSDHGRAVAANINRALKAANKAFLAGEQRVEKILNSFHKTISEHEEITVEYVELLQQKSLKVFAGAIDGPAVVLVAAHVEGVRLIDNLELG